MTTQLIGTTFPPSSQWYTNEVNLVKSICKQIDTKFPEQKNLLISTTWFGPQFHNGEFDKLVQYENQIDNLFFMSSVDATMISPPQIDAIIKRINPSQTFFLGNFDGPYYFSFIASVLPEYFENYTDDQLIMKTVRWLFVNYNRKPREHRIKLVNQLIENNLHNTGVVSLGNQELEIYAHGVIPQKFFLLGETPEQYAKAGNWGHGLKFGIPHDIHSLGNMDIWQTHFLNIVSETECNNWDPLFVTEKTWKPMIGLRPFIINGQPKIYKWLRQQGFRTFNHYFCDGLEDEENMHSAIIQTLLELKQKPADEIVQLYNRMLPDLLHNRAQFFEFAHKEKQRINNILQ